MPDTHIIKREVGDAVLSLISHLSSLIFHGGTAINHEPEPVDVSSPIPFYIANGAGATFLFIERALTVVVTPLLSMKSCRMTTLYLFRLVERPPYMRKGSLRQWRL